MRHPEAVGRFLRWWLLKNGHLQIAGGLEGPPARDGLQIVGLDAGCWMWSGSIA